MEPVRVKSLCGRVYIDCAPRLWFDYGMLVAPPIVADMVKALADSWQGTFMQRGWEIQLKFEIDLLFGDAEAKGYLPGPIPEWLKPRGWPEGISPG